MSNDNMCRLVSGRDCKYQGYFNCTKEGSCEDKVTPARLLDSCNTHIAAKFRKAIKPYIVKRPNGGCQVLFPLTELDSIIDAATSA